jgi:molybdopterin synthase catalytic subunit
MKRVSIQSGDFGPAEELAALESLGGGGVASFTGIVRGGGGLTALELQHYAAMTADQVGRIVDDAMSRWPLLGVRVIHRFGKLAVGDRIVFVGTASRHRTAALESCAFLIDWLKSDAPFWKKEHFAGHPSVWVEARPEDETKARDWKQ